MPVKRAYVAAKSFKGIAHEPQTMLVLPPDVKLTGRLAESAVQDWA